MARGPRNLRITFDADALSHYGGAAFVHQFLQRIGLRSHPCVVCAVPTAQQPLSDQRDDPPSGQPRPVRLQAGRWSQRESKRQIILKANVNKPV